MSWVWIIVAFLVVVGLVWFLLDRDAKNQAKRRGTGGTTPVGVDLPRGIEKRLEDGKDLPPGQARKVDHINDEPDPFGGKGKGRENAPGQLKKEEE